MFALLISWKLLPWRRGGRIWYILVSLGSSLHAGIENCFNWVLSYHNRLYTGSWGLNFWTVLPSLLRSQITPAENGKQGRQKQTRLFQLNLHTCLSKSSSLRCRYHKVKVCGLRHGTTWTSAGGLSLERMCFPLHIAILTPGAHLGLGESVGICVCEGVHFASLNDPSVLRSKDFILSCCSRGCMVQRAQRCWCAVRVGSFGCEFSQAYKVGFSWLHAHTYTSACCLDSAKAGSLGSVYALSKQKSNLCQMNHDLKMHISLH